MFYVLSVELLCCLKLMYSVIIVWVTEWENIGKIAAHSAYDMFS